MSARLFTKPGNRPTSGTEIAFALAVAAKVVPVPAVTVKRLAVLVANPAGRLLPVYKSCEKRRLFSAASAERRPTHRETFAGVFFIGGLLWFLDLNFNFFHFLHLFLIWPY